MYIRTVLFISIDWHLQSFNCYYYFVSAQIDNLERQTSRDAATITKLNSELRQFNSTQKENNSEIGKLQKEVQILVKDCTIGTCGCIRILQLKSLSYHSGVPLT